jgi:hypothetical protein
MQVRRWQLLLMVLGSALLGTDCLLVAYERRSALFLICGLFLTWCAADGLWATIWGPTASDRPDGDGGPTRPPTGQE